MGDSNRTGQRVDELRRFADGATVVPILVQQEPDPDGMASALAIRSLLDRTADESPVISLGEVTRPENRRMGELLEISVTRVTDAELNGFERVIVVDTQPPAVESRTRFAVIDHHPVRRGYTTDFVDIRPRIGAVATMLTEYLRAAGTPISARLATALIYGIRTDTDVLRRDTSPEDVAAYAFLQQIADHELLRKIGRPAFSESGVRAVGRGLAGLKTAGGIAAAFAGRLDPQSHVLPSLADFCLSIEGIAWSAAAGIIGEELVITIRRIGGDVGAGDLAKALAEEEGLGGGHRSMARVAIRSLEAVSLSDEPGDPAAVDWLLDRLEAGVEAARWLRSD